MALRLLHRACGPPAAHSPRRCTFEWSAHSFSHPCAQWQERRRRTSPSDGCVASLCAEAFAGDGDAEEEEAVDQRVAASRQQIKALLRALAASRAGTGSPGVLPRPSTPATRRSKLDLRLATAMHRRTLEEE